MNLSFNKKSLIVSKNKASANWEKHNFIFSRFSNILFEKVNEINSQFKNILLITSDAFECYNQLSKLNFENFIIISQYKKLLNKISPKKNNVFKVLSSFEKISLETNKYDLIVCNFCFHKINDKIKYIQNLHRLLEKNGVLFCNFFGENSLIELRNSLMLTDQKVFNGSYLRTSPNTKMIDAANLFISQGFEELVSEVVNYKIQYQNVYSLLKDIKMMGENNSLKKKFKALVSKNYLDILNKTYLSEYSCKNSLLNATCDIVSISMWKKKVRIF